MMKLLLAHTLYYPNILGGAERSIQILAENMQMRGVDVSVVCIHALKDTIKYHNGVKVHYLHHRNLYYRYQVLPTYKVVLKPLHYLLDTFNPILGKALEDVIIRENPHIVHTNNLYGLSPIIWNISKKRKIRLIHTIRDHQLICARGHMYRKDNRCIRQCLSCRLLTMSRRELSEKVDVAIGISNYILEKHLQLGLFKNCFYSKVIHNPIIASQTVLPKRSINKPLRFLYLGGTFESKGFHLIIKTFDKLQKYNNKWELWIGGPGNNKEQHNSSIRFLGVVDPKYVYPEVDVVIVPSLLNEAFGRVIVEANSYGLPVIGSNRGAIPELVIDGETGFIFDPDDEKDFLLKIIRFIEEPSLIFQLSRGCLTHSQRFRIEKIIDEYMGAYDYF